MVSRVSFIDERSDVDVDDVLKGVAVVDEDFEEFPLILVETGVTFWTSGVAVVVAVTPSVSVSEAVFAITEVGLKMACGMEVVGAGSKTVSVAEVLDVMVDVIVMSSEMTSVLKLITGLIVNDSRPLVVATLTVFTSAVVNCLITDSDVETVNMPAVTDVVVMAGV